MSDVSPLVAERQLWIGVVKIALLIAIVLMFGALLLNGLFGLDGQLGQYGVSALLFAVSMSIVANGFLAVLRIVDWFEARKAKVDG